MILDVLECKVATIVTKQVILLVTALKSEERHAILVANLVI